MIPTKHTLRRSEQPIQIGPRHGYRIEGDHAFINAELHVPAHADASACSLELWATEEPYRHGPLTGAKVAGVALELPTPIGPSVHIVDTRVAARLPLQGRAHAMVLALVEHGANGERSVHAFANYPALQTFVAPHFEGSVGYRIDGREVVLEADSISNPRSDANLSGSLSVELWAFPVSGPSNGLRLAAAELSPLAGQASFNSVERRVAFSEPPAGRYQLALQLCEWTGSNGYVPRDRRDFVGEYERSAPEPASTSTTALPAPHASDVTPVVVLPSERLRLVPAVEPKVVEKSVEPKVVEPKAVEKPVATKVVEKPVGAGLVSIQTATVEELAAVSGLNLKLAKEIIKARPFASLAELIRVRGIGEKSIVRLKGLLTL